MPVQHFKPITLIGVASWDETTMTTTTTSSLHYIYLPLSKLQLLKTNFSFSGSLSGNMHKFQTDYNVVNKYAFLLLFSYSSPFNLIFIPFIPSTQFNQLVVDINEALIKWDFFPPQHLHHSFIHSILIKRSTREKPKQIHNLCHQHHTATENHQQNSCEHFPKTKLNQRWC